MITKSKVLENINDAIFEAITTSCCIEEDSCGCRYYLHGNEKTGDLYEYSDEQSPQNVLFFLYLFWRIRRRFRTRKHGQRRLYERRRRFSGSVVSNI